MALNLTPGVSCYTGLALAQLSLSQLLDMELPAPGLHPSSPVRSLGKGLSQKGPGGKLGLCSFSNGTESY